MMLLHAMTIIGAALAHAVRGDTFIIGYLAPSPDELMDRMQGPAINIAIETFQANGWL